MTTSSTSDQTLSFTSVPQIWQIKTLRNIWKKLSESSIQTLLEINLMIMKRTRLFENLRMLPHAPGVQMQPIPEDAIDQESEDEDKQDGDERISIRASEKRIARDDEFSDSEDEGDGRRDNRSHKPKAKKSRTEANNSLATNANTSTETKDKNNEDSKKKEKKDSTVDSTEKKANPTEANSETPDPESVKSSEDKSEPNKR